jgi:hypothetical protein
METEKSVGNLTQPEFRKIPERRAVGISTRPENAGTPNGRNSDPFGNIGKPTRLEIRPKRKMFGNLDIRKKGAGPIYRLDTEEDRAG